MIIFDVDDPLVLNGTYDREGFRPNERVRIAKAWARQTERERPIVETHKKFSGKRQTRKPSASASRARRRRVPVPRTTTHRPNGSPPEVHAAPAEPVPIGEAMRRAVEQLGEVVIDDKLAASQLRELAECYEEIARDQAAFTAKSEAAKIAKKSLDASTNVLLEKLRAFTHPTPLPLFDGVQAEQDERDMLAGGDIGESASV